MAGSSNKSGGKWLAGLVTFAAIFSFQNCAGSFRQSNLDSAAFQSTSVLQDLNVNFWSGTFPGGNIRPTWWGYSSAAVATAAGATTAVVNDVSGAAGTRGGVWDRSGFYHFLFHEQQLTGSADVKAAMVSDWAFFKTQFSLAEVGTCGASSAANFASDDTAWNSRFFLEAYQVTGDDAALQYAKAAVACGYGRWATNTSYGLWYSDDHHGSSLYEVGLALQALKIYQLTGDASFQTMFQSSYDFIQAYLQRTDGLYWADYDVTNAVAFGASQPNQIAATNSVSFLAGNMGMAVVNAGLYRSTGQDIYRQRVLATVNGILSRYLQADGTLLNDRDAWTDASFAIEFAREVLSLDGMPTAMKTALRATASSILNKARTPDAYYSGDWSGGTTWTAAGAKAQQIYTSTQAAQMILAVDFLGN